MIIAKNDSEDIALKWSTHTTIENILNTALIDDKSKWYSRLEKIKYEYEGQEMIEDLKQYLPIMGYHSIPVIERDAMEATRLRRERDNFQEERWKKEF